MDLNLLLKNFRVKNKFTQDELAQKLYVSHQTISKWELGINTPSIDNLLLLSDLYNISLDELIRGGNYLKKPFLVGKKVSKRRFTLFFITWLLASLLLTGATSHSIWLVVFITGLFIVIPTMFEDYWILEKKGISMQLFPNTIMNKIITVYHFLFNPSTKLAFLPFEDIAIFEIKYIKKERYSPFDYRPDSFFIKIVMGTHDTYELPIHPKFIQYLPQACLYLEKKDILIVDTNNLIDAIINKENLFAYMHEL